jgi:hypothetical protein
MRRAALAVALGGFTSLLLERALGAGGGAGLRATVVAAPLVLGLLAAVGLRLGARPASGGERLLAAGWIAVAVHVDALALGPLDAAVFAAGLLLFGRRVLALLPTLRRAVGRRGALAWRPFAALAFVVGLAVLPWVEARGEPLGDEPYFLLLAESWWSDGDGDLADEYRDGVARGFLGRDLGPQPGDPVGPAGQRYSRHGSLLPLLLAPFWAAGGVFGARLAMLVLWSLLAGSILRLALAFDLPERAAFRAALVASFAPPLLLYAHAIWVEAPAALAVAVALESWRRERSAGDRPSSAGRRIAFVAALVALPLLKLRLLAVALPLGALPLIGARGRRRQALWALASLAVATAAILLHNLDRVGNALRIYRPRDLALTQVSIGQGLTAAWGLLFDVAFGLLAWSPIWLLALPGIAVAVARRSGYAPALAAMTPYLVLIGSRREWFGGWSPPFRYGVLLVPLLAIGFAELWRRPRGAGARRLAAALGALTALAALAAWIEPGWMPSFADGRSRLHDLAAAPFAADFARFLPSAVRPRLATWVVPTFALAVAVIVYRGRRRWQPARRASRAVATLGVAGLLLAGAGLVEAAHRVPTGVVEAEDPWLARRGGALFPSRWTFDRTRFDGGWTMASGHRLELTPVAGGDELVVRVRVRTLRRSAAPAALALFAGGEARRTWKVEPGGHWQWLESEPLDWRPGSRLGLLARNWHSERSAIVVDRLELDWR